MKLETITNVLGGISIVSNDNNIDIITEKVKIKNKRSTSAMQAKERLENQYNNGIDKGNSKKAFFNKHKNN